MKKIFLFILIIIAYFTVLIIINPNIFVKTDVPYYNFLIDAFIHHRLNVFPDNWWDLSLYNNRLYLYWGPAPVLFILPFYWLFGINASDVLYTVIMGLLNTILFSLIITEANRYFRLKTSAIPITILIVSFALATPNFFLSLCSKIWMTNQVFATGYLLIFLWSYFRYFNTVQVRYLVLSCLFFNLAWLSRYTLVFYFILYAYPVILKLRIDIKSAVRLIGILASATIPFIAFFFIYNYLRFHNFWETGVHYQLGNPRYAEIIKNGPILSPIYIPYNFYYYFLNPFSLATPNHFFQIDFEGNSVFLCYPLLFCLFYFFKKTPSHWQLFINIAELTAISIIIVLLMNFATGYVQFGNRYFFDTVPILYVLILMIIRKIPLSLQKFLLVCGIAINLLGILNFYKMI